MIAVSFAIASAPLYRFRLIPPAYDETLWRLNVKGWFFWNSVNFLSCFEGYSDGSGKGRGAGMSIEQITDWAHEEARKWCAAKNPAIYHFTMEPDK